MPKLTFDEAIERLQRGHYVQAHEVQAHALQRKVWVAEWHIPGCLSESFSYTDSKHNAVAIALEYCGHVRGARADLMRHGMTDRVPPDAYVSMAITTIEQTTLRSIL